MTPAITTANWNDGPSETKLWTRRTRAGGNRWGTRRVRRDGTVRWFGRTFRPKADVAIKPVPGEILLFTDYGEAWNLRFGGRPIVMEWTAPSESDGFIRRADWEVAG